MAGTVVQCDFVGAIDTGNFPQQLAGGGIDHHHAVLAGDEESVAGGIDGDGIPAAVTTELDLAHDVVRRGSLRRGNAEYRTERNSTGPHDEADVTRGEGCGHPKRPVRCLWHTLWRCSHES